MLCFAYVSAILLHTASFLRPVRCPSTHTHTQTTHTHTHVYKNIQLVGKGGKMGIRVCVNVRISKFAYTASGQLWKLSIDLLLVSGGWAMDAVPAKAAKAAA